MRGLHFPLRVAPQNRGAALWRDHAVDGVLLHQDPIANRETECSAAATLACHDDDDGHFQNRHLAKVERDGFGDASLFGFDTWIGSRRIDKRNDRTLKFLGERHQTHGLAVSLGPGVSEVAIDLRLGVTALVMTDDHHRLALVARGTGHNRVIVGKTAVAMHLDEVGEQPLDVVKNVRTARVARHEHALPGRELAVDLRPRGLQAMIQPLELALARIGPRQRQERIHFLQQRNQRVFEL